MSTRVSRGLLAACCALWGLLPGCSPVDDSRCAMFGIADSDGDGLDDRHECILNSNPQDADSDQDGLRDKVEYEYPRACIVAFGPQRLPPAPCEADAYCLPGEYCLGLRINERDSDGDGVLDGHEDENGQASSGSLSFLTDPRLSDSDGDGLPDGKSGVAACRQNSRPALSSQSLGALQLAFDSRMMATMATADAAGSTLLIDDWTADVAAAGADLPTARPTLADDRVALEDAVRRMLIAEGASVQDIDAGHAYGPSRISSILQVRKTGGAASALRDTVLAALAGRARIDSILKGGGDAFYLELSYLRVIGGSVTVLFGVSTALAHDRPDGKTAERVHSLIDGSALALGGTYMERHCDQRTATSVTGEVPVPSTVISASLRVAVRNQVVPRSRVSGFDFDPENHVLRFFGAEHTPQPGDVVHLSSEQWTPFSQG